MAMFEQNIGTPSGLRKAGLVFLTLLPDWRKRVDAAMAMNDWVALSDHLHQMKGCCSMMCATIVVRQLQTAETDLRRGRIRALVNCLDALDSLLREMEVELRSVWLAT